MIKVMRIVLIILLSAPGLNGWSQKIFPAEPEFVTVHTNASFFVAGESLLFKIYCNDHAGRPSSVSSIAYVELIDKDKKPLTRIKIALHDGAGSGEYFFGGNVPTGNYTLLAYTKWMRNFEVADFFTSTLTVVNPSVKPDVASYGSQVVQKQLPSISSPTGSLPISMTGIEFLQRAKVTIRISPDSTAKWNLSVSARSLTAIDQSTLPATIASTSERTRAVEMKFLPDMRGELITGVIKRTSTGRPVTGKLVSLSSSSKNFKYVVSTTDSTGRYYFNVKPMETDFVVLKVHGDDGSNFIHEASSGFLEDHSVFAPPALQLDSGMRLLMEERYMRAQVENAFYSLKRDSLLIDATNARRFLTPDKVYKLDDFMRFPTMEDVFREIIGEIVVKARDNKFTLSINNPVTGERFNGEPLVLIDGIPISNHDMVMKYDPLRVQSIAVVTHHYFYGGSEHDGIISIETYDGDAQNVVIDDLLRLPYIPVAPEKRHYSPDYERGADRSRVPDFRTQLYWNPAVTIYPGQTQTLSFFTSDIPGQYSIDIIGVSDSGQKIQWSKIFFIK